jgi:hypothetical protein
MAVLPLYAARHGRQPIERTEGSGPIGYGHAGIVAGDQRAGDDQQKRSPSQDYDESMVRRVV